MTVSTSNNVTHEQSIKIIFNYTIELLKRLQAFTEEPLPSNASDKMRKHIKDINKATIASINDLKTPTLRLAYVGATSSGKSTVVNALTGHRIMPMETKEMSAGIVRIHHDSTKTDEMHFQLEEALQNGESVSGLWNSIDTDCKQDKEIYNPLSECMQLYHDKRESIENLKAPNAEIWCNTWLGSNRELLQLPEGIQLEILDLPGIKEVDDPANMSVVQETLGKNVLTLVMNYADTAESRLNGLLQEIKQIIEIFHGDTSSLLFVLNKIDLWNLNDGELDKKIDDLARKIQQVLNLDNKPIIYPMKSQSLMLPQVALGQTNINNRSEEESLMYLSESLDRYRLTTIKDRWYRRELDGLCSDLYDEISNIRIQDKNVKIVLHDGDKLEQYVEEIKSILAAENHQETILDVALKESGMASYLQNLQSRIEDHFARLIVQPAIGKLIADTRQYIKEMKGECLINIQNNIKELELLIDKIEKAQQNVEKRLDDIRKKIETEKSIVVNKLSSSEMKDRTALMEYLKGKDEIDGSRCQYLTSVYDIFNIVDNDIQASASDKIQAAIQSFLDKMSITESDLKSSLKDNGVSAFTSNSLLQSLVKMKRHFSNHGSTIKWKSNYDNRIEISGIINDYNECLSQFPKVIGDYLVFALQAKSQKFEDTLVKATQIIRQDIVDSLKTEMLDKTISDSIVPEFEYIVQHVNMTFDVTKLRNPASTLQAVDKTETVTRRRERTWGEFGANMVSWLWGSHTPSVVEYTETTEYITLNLGTSQEYLEEMAKIIRDGKTTIMQSIGNWFSVSSDRVIDLIIKKTDETLKHYKDICKQKQQEARQTTHEKQVVWQNYKANLEAVLKEEQNRDSILGDIDAVIEQGINGVPENKKTSPISTNDSFNDDIPLSSPAMKNGGRPGQRTLD